VKQMRFIDDNSLLIKIIRCINYPTIRVSDDNCALKWAGVYSLVDVLPWRERERWIRRVVFAVGCSSMDCIEDVFNKMIIRIKNICEKNISVHKRRMKMHRNTRMRNELVAKIISRNTKSS
jgi:hypothetical protein